MKILEKLFNLFIKTKRLAVSVEEKINKFIRDYKREILMTMSILETIFPAGSGPKKMGCVVSNVCAALGYENVSGEIANFVTDKCQKIYDEFKASLQ